MCVCVFVCYKGNRALDRVCFRVREGKGRGV